MTDPKQELIEGLCSVMHDAYEAAAAKAGWETQERSRKPWADVPEANKVTMRAAVAASVDALTFMGWVSPEEAKAREAAARREALLEAAECPSDGWGITWQSRARRLTAEVKRLRATVARVEALAEEWEQPVEGRQEYATLAFQCAADEVRDALAEPERDEEPEEIHHCDGCGEDYNILAESHIGHRPERDEEGGR